MKEIQKQAIQLDQVPPCEFLCSECKWLIEGFRCGEPLIRGFDKETEPNVDWQLSKGYYPSPMNWPNTQLCGLEKLLWCEHEKPAQPLSSWQRLLKALGA